MTGSVDLETLDLFTRVLGLIGLPETEVDLETIDVNAAPIQENMVTLFIRDNPWVRLIESILIFHLHFL
jgi:hypothetical protein